jgi:hypothetical protein
MKLQWGMLCHDIQPYGTGGLTIIGIFGQLSVDRLPGTVTPLQVAFRLAGTPGERAIISVHVVDPNGNTIAERPADPVALSGFGFLDASISLAPLSIRIPGLHIVRVMNGDVEIGTIPLPIVIVRLM